MPSSNLPALLEAVDAAARAQDITALFVLMGTIDAARDCCLRAIARRMGHSQEPSQGGNGAAGGPQTVHDRWVAPQIGADRLGISLRTLRRRWRRPPYSAFCVPQPGRGFKVSEAALDDHMRRERERARR